MAPDVAESAWEIYDAFLNSFHPKAKQLILKKFDG